MSELYNKKYPTLIKIQNGSKVTCSLTGHEMKADESVIQCYINCKKYKRALSVANFDYSSYEPHLVPSNKRQTQNQLFCKLTLRHLNKQPEHVLRHVNGKRYQKALKKWEDCQKQGIAFKPRCGQSTRRHEEKESWESDDGDNDAENSDMDDLYPDLDSSEGAESAAEPASGKSDPKLKKQKPKLKSKEKTKTNDKESCEEDGSDEFQELSSDDEEEKKSPVKTVQNGKKSSDGKKNKKKTSSHDVSGKRKNPTPATSNHKKKKRKQ